MHWPICFVKYKIDLIFWSAFCHMIICKNVIIAVCLDAHLRKFCRIPSDSQKQWLLMIDHSNDWTSMPWFPRNNRFDPPCRRRDDRVQRVLLIEHQCHHFPETIGLVQRDDRVQRLQGEPRHPLHWVPLGKLLRCSFTFLGRLPSLVSFIILTQARSARKKTGGSTRPSARLSR